MFQVSIVTGGRVGGGDLDEFTLLGCSEMHSDDVRRDLPFRLLQLSSFSLVLSAVQCFLISQLVISQFY